MLRLLAALYQFFVKRRNRLYDKGVFHSARFDIPILCIGNITVGGTGKTPHTEYLIRLLKNLFPIAVLSRGYKRKSKGFLMADAHSDAQQIGDEPLQISQKFSDIKVAVCEKREVGIKELLKRYPETKAILLDDAFQHRQVSPSLSMVLIDYNRPTFEDKLLPAGRLREPIEGLQRADMVIVSKCPSSLSEEAQDSFKKRLALQQRQGLYFTRIRYSDFHAAFPEKAFQKTLTAESVKTGKRPVLGFCGIASPAPFIDYLQSIHPQCKCLLFPDHHFYTPSDIQNITQAFARLESENALLVTTEKDYFRLRGYSGLESLTPYIYYVPLEIEFLNHQEEDFNQKIIQHVRCY